MIIINMLEIVVLKLINSTENNQHMFFTNEKQNFVYRG